MVVLPKNKWFPSAAPRRDEPTMGILAFEAGRAISRLVGLYRTLSGEEILRLRSTTMRSTGVAYLNSTDQLFLLRLACAELLEELDQSAAAVSRLAGGCTICHPREFLHFYSDLKSGYGELTAGFRGSEVEKGFGRLEKHASRVSKLQMSMERVAEMEAAARRGGKGASSELMQKKLSSERQAVRKLQAESIWSASRRKVGELMARAVVTIFVRLCAVFAPVALELPLVVPDRNGRYQFSMSQRFRYNFSAPLLGRPVTGLPPQTSNSGPLPANPIPGRRQWTTFMMEPGSGKLGGSGLALQYARVVDLAKRMLEDGAGEGAREELYGLLPSGVRGKLRAKLRGCRKVAAEEGRVWREAAGKMLEWLAPMAEETERWYNRRSCERKGPETEEEEERRVLALQTLVFSDREKAEAAVVEVLVALSRVWRCEQQTTAAGDFQDTVI